MAAEDSEALMPGLRDILEAATPGWKSAGVAVYAGERFTETHRPIAVFHTEEADATLAALAPELAVLCLQMGDVLRDSGCSPRVSDEGTSYCPHCEVLARLDQLGKEQTT